MAPERTPERNPAPTSALLDLVAVIDRLRLECPWDREQTHRSLARYLLEETYEVLEVLDRTGDLEGGGAELCEELGDLLMQVYFHARIASESGAFGIEDVARGIADKLVRRHPHVFAGVEVADAAEVERNWDALKAAEKQRSSVVEGIPSTLPALAYAEKVLGRLARQGTAPPQSASTLGEELLLLVAKARAEGLDPEQELRDAVRRLLPG